MSENVQKLQNFLREIANQLGYIDANIDIEAISTEGANFTSDLFLATISAPKKENVKLFVKVANINESLREANNVFASIYEREHSFYSKLAVAFEQLYNKHNVPTEDRLYITKFYGYKSDELEETLVLENLSAKGFINFDRMKTFNWEYASKSIEQLAKFHALGLALKEENFEEFEKLCKTDIDMTNESVTKVIMNQAFKNGTQVIKEEYRERVRKFLESNDLLIGLKKLWAPSGTGFLIHSDYRPNNLMHRRRNGKLEVVPVDYQSYHVGSIAAELMNFIWVGSDGQFRKYYYKQLIEHYYMQLTHALKNLRVDISKVYPRKVFEQDLEEAQTLGLLIGLGMISILTVEPENVPKMESFDSIIVEPNQLAKDRMNEIVEDYARWGII